MPRELYHHADVIRGVQRTRQSLDLMSRKEKQLKMRGKYTETDKERDLMWNYLFGLDRVQPLDRRHVRR